MGDGERCRTLFACMEMLPCNVVVTGDIGLLIDAPEVLLVEDGIGLGIEDTVPVIMDSTMNQSTSLDP